MENEYGMCDKDCTYRTPYGYCKLATCNKSLQQGYIILPAICSAVLQSEYEKKEEKEEIGIREV